MSFFVLFYLDFYVFSVFQITVTIIILDNLIVALLAMSPHIGFCVHLVRLVFNVFLAYW